MRNISQQKYEHLKKILTKGECISVDAYIEGGEGKARECLKTGGVKNLQNLNSVLEKTVTPWSNYLM